MWRRDVRRALDRLEAVLARVERKVDDLALVVLREGRELMALIDDVLTDVEDLPTVDASLGQFLDNLKQQLADALANGDTAKLQAIKDAIDQHKARIIAEIQANTATP